MLFRQVLLLNYEKIKIILNRKRLKFSEQEIVFHLLILKEQNKKMCHFKNLYDYEMLSKI